VKNCFEISDTQVLGIINACLQMAHKQETAKGWTARTLHSCPLQRAAPFLTGIELSQGRAEHCLNWISYRHMRSTESTQFSIFNSAVF
jgi:hypothetical protein